MTCLTVYSRKPPDNTPETLPFVISSYGQLKLSVFKEHEILVVSVLEARDMLSEGQGSCNSYVKIGMFPDSDPEKRQKTLMVPQCRNPIFLQTFYLTVSEEDLHKRLLFTVWNYDAMSRLSSLLGCMSFGLRSLMDADKEVHGWYYLLGEELGRWKHLKVPTEHNHHTTVESILCVSMAMWYGSDTVQERKDLAQVMRTAQGIVGCCLQDVDTVYAAQVRERTRRIDTRAMDFLSHFHQGAFISCIHGTAQ